MVLGITPNTKFVYSLKEACIYKLLLMYGFSLFKMSTQRVGILNYNPPASRVVTIVIRKNHLSIL